MSYNSQIGVPVFSLFQALFLFTFSSPNYMTIYMTIYMTGFLWRDLADAQYNDAYGGLNDIEDVCGTEALPSIEQIL